jgi:ATP-dependent DNA helicase HFM1/MER3
MFKPTVPSAAWPTIPPDSGEKNRNQPSLTSNKYLVDKRQRSIQEFTIARTLDDEYGIDAINDSDIIRLAENAEQTNNSEDDHIDDPQLGVGHNPKFTMRVGVPNAMARIPYLNRVNQSQRLPNGKYPCKHSCKDKTRCKHLCCREGLDEPPKSGKKRRRDSDLTVRFYNRTDMKT